MAMVKTKSRKENKNKITWKEIKRQKVLLFWAAVMVIYGIIFYYLPLGQQLHPSYMTNHW